MHSLIMVSLDYNGIMIYWFNMVEIVIIKAVCCS